MTGHRALIAALQRLRDPPGDGIVTLGHLLDSLREAGFCLIAMLIALPFLQPFLPLGPYSTVGAFAFILLGAQLLLGYPEPTLPERLRKLVVAPLVMRMITRLAVGFLRGCRRYTRLRHLRWVTGTRGRLMIGSVMMGGGLIMAIPFFGIPLNDFFPAIAIVSACIGELERDGLMVLMALAWLAVGAIYCAFLLIVLAFLGRDAWMAMSA